MDGLNRVFLAKTSFFTVCNLYSDILQAGECTNYIIYTINIKKLTAHKLFVNHTHRHTRGNEHYYEVKGKGFRIKHCSVTASWDELMDRF